MLDVKSGYEMNQLGAVLWASLDRQEVETDIAMTLMQVVISLEQLPRWHAWFRKFRKENANTPGMDFLEVWSVPMIDRAAPRSRLQILNVRYPSSLGMMCFDEYRQQMGFSAKL